MDESWAAWEFWKYAEFTVEITSKEQNKSEVNDAMHKEIENIIRYDVFEEVEDCGQEMIELRLLITQKEKSDGQKW